MFGAAVVNMRPTMPPNLVDLPSEGFTLNTHWASQTDTPVSKMPANLFFLLLGGHKSLSLFW